MKHQFVILITALALCSCHRTQQDRFTQALPDGQQRDSLIAAMLNSHDFMHAFLTQARSNDHARMMMTHLVFSSDTSSMGADCPMQQGSAQSSKATVSPYVGQEGRSIKALSPDEIQKYRDGEGMGLAKAAELNHYPGPRHVLNLASDLKLSQEQVARIRKLYDDMHEKAVKLGKNIIEGETKLDALFASDTITKSELDENIRKLGVMQGELRLTHLSAHLGMKEILTSGQALQYDHLRGYHHEEHAQ